jgi:predicted AAA+ superfamily ATPase
MPYRKRVLEQKLLEYVKHFSVVGVTGPRQSGKSTLLRHALKDYEYVTFDDPGLVELLLNDPQKFLRIYSNKVIFDEVQKIPELFNLIKMAVDNDRNRVGKYVLIGSSQFAVIKGVTESLAGRIGLLTQLPFQISEMPEGLREEAVFKGSYPELVQKHYTLFEDWYSSYLDTYLTKDVSALANIGDKRDFIRLIRLLAANTSQLLNMSRLATDIGVDVKTIRRWISVLEASYIVFLLPPYFKNYGKRIVKSPKVYFYDTGLVSYLTGITTKQLFDNGPMTGPIFENHVVSEVLKRELHRKTNSELFFLRTNHGDEIDLIVDRKHSRDLIEIKSSETFTPKMTKTIEAFMEKDDKGFLLYRGKSQRYLLDVEVMHYLDYFMP